MARRSGAVAAECWWGRWGAAPALGRRSGDGRTPLWPRPGATHAFLRRHSGAPPALLGHRPAFCRFRPRSGRRWPTSASVEIRPRLGQHSPIPAQILPAYLATSAQTRPTLGGTGVSTPGHIWPISPELALEFVRFGPASTAISARKRRITTIWTEFGKRLVVTNLASTYTWAYPHMHLDYKRWTCPCPSWFGRARNARPPPKKRVRSARPHVSAALGPRCGGVPTNLP